MTSSVCCAILNRASAFVRCSALVRNGHYRFFTAIALPVDGSRCYRWVCPVSSYHRQFSTVEPAPQKAKETVKFHFLFPDGTRKTATAKVGDNLLDTVISNNLDIDGYGACEGTLACSTCHLIFKQSDYAKLPQKPTDEELDMLDLAYGLADTSRLGCQVIVTKDMDGWEVTVPGGISDARG